MTGAVRAPHRAPTRQAPAGTRAAATDGTVPPGKTAARAGAVHPVPVLVPKSFRSKERQS
ncbi:hypothetical protein OOK13_34135 [Streptomyces sp. NBC_00378]|uniref:hypothetical protein n=1 Tax=unclassified Streptomyces TaxID=2593676 RepID=UPI002256E814|nr:MULTISPECIES: hypothetical protein [unclassified Streptomyces]MCX5113409.1 hypothetical protein [Streptomyces sp. NBC_00378]